MKSILDQSFQYTPSFDTDLKKTFARVRRLDKDMLEGAERRCSMEPTRPKRGSVHTCLDGVGIIERSSDTEN
jgi:hypothetical protein